MDYLDDEENYDGSGALEYMDNESYQAKADVNTISSISCTLYVTSFIVMSPHGWIFQFLSDSPSILGFYQRVKTDLHFGRNSVATGRNHLAKQRIEKKISAN